MTCVVEPARVVGDAEVVDVDLGPVLHEDGLPRHTLPVHDLRGVEGQRAENHRQQDGEVRDKAAVAAEAVFAPDRRAVQLLAFAVQRCEVLPQLFHPRGGKLHRVGRLGRARRLALRRADDASDADQGAQAQIQAQQHQQQDEVPALKHAV